MCNQVLQEQIVAGETTQNTVQNPAVQEQVIRSGNFSTVESHTAPNEEYALLHTILRLISMAVILQSV